MAFINEYVSEENIEKYNLEALYRKMKWGDNWTPPGFRFAWTFDAERNSFYIPLKHGREEFSHHCRGVLYFKGIHWDVEVASGPNNSRSFAEIPYRQNWELIHIKHPEGNAVPMEEIIPVLKDALTAFKIDGIYSYVDDVVTAFGF